MADEITATDADSAEAPATEAVPGDELREGLLATLRAALGDAVLSSEIAAGDIWVRVERGAWKDAARACKEQLRCDYFCFLSGIDWMPNPSLAGEKVWDTDGTVEAIGEEADEAPGVEGDAPAAADGGATELQTGVAGGDSRFQVFARLYSTTGHYGVTLKADLDDAAPTVDSIVELYRGADWHERETWEMYGFEFSGHPSLRHLYLPGEFEGHPLRKDYPLLAREVKPWPGLVDVEPMPGEPDDAAAEGEAEGGSA